MFYVKMGLSQGEQGTLYDVNLDEQCWCYVDQIATLNLTKTKMKINYKITAIHESAIKENVLDK